MTKTKKHYVLNFVTLDGVTKFYANGNGELSNGEQTTKPEKAIKFNTRKEAEKVNAGLDAWYFVSTMTEPMSGVYIF